MVQSIPFPTLLPLWLDFSGIIDRYIWHSLLPDFYKTLLCKVQRLNKHLRPHRDGGNLRGTTLLVRPLKGRTALVSRYRANPAPATDFTGSACPRRAPGEFSLLSAPQAHCRAHTSLSRLAGGWLTTPGMALKYSRVGNGRSEIEPSSVFLFSLLSLIRWTQRDSNSRPSQCH